MQGELRGPHCKTEGYSQEAVTCGMFLVVAHLRSLDKQIQVQMLVENLALPSLKKLVGWDKALPVTFTKKGFVCCCTKALRIVPAWDIPQWLQRARINFTRINYFDNTSELFQQKENKWSTKE